MTRDEARRALLEAIASVAPEADLAGLDPRRPLRDQIDLDSMDFLNVFLAVHRALGVEIPEADYGRLSTLDGAVDYLVQPSR